jgi:hypothetical protein
LYGHFCDYDNDLIIGEAGSEMDGGLGHVQQVLQEYLSA